MNNGIEARSRFSNLILIDGLIAPLGPLYYLGMMALNREDLINPPLLNSLYLIGFTAVATGLLRTKQDKDPSRLQRLTSLENRGIDAIKAAAMTVSLQVRHLARVLTRKSHISS